MVTLEHIADNPISLAEAVVDPFKRLGRAFTRKIESMTKDAEKKLDQTGEASVMHIKEGATPPAEAPAPPPVAAPQGGLLAGGGIAVAALGSSLTFITKTMSGLGPGGVLRGLLVAILAVMIPSLIIQSW